LVDGLVDEEIRAPKGGQVGGQAGGQVSGQAGGTIGSTIGSTIGGVIGGAIDFFTDRQKEVLGLIVNNRITCKKIFEKLSINESAVADPPNPHSQPKTTVLSFLQGNNCT
jgi:uncharacterized protein YcfJ